MEWDGIACQGQLKGDERRREQSEAGFVTDE